MCSQSKLGHKLYYWQFDRRESMTILITGLILFLGMHSVRIFAENWRLEQIYKRGEKTWQAIFSIISLSGFILIIWGYSEARVVSQILWYPPVWTRHAAALLILLGFVFIVAADISGTKIKSKIGHPMIVGVKLWAFGHLISNGSVADIVLFASFLVWAILDFRASRQRDKANGLTYEFTGYHRDLIAITIGLILGVVFVLYLHDVLIGVKPFA